jgi:hypothetical protein
LNCGSYTYVFLDACFISRLMQVDKTCGLIDFFGPYADANCVVKMNQYNETPCNFYVCDCDDLDKIFLDEKALQLQKGTSTISIDFTRISRDPNDVKIFIWGFYINGAAILTCDKGLLSMCREHNIPRCCFKAAIKCIDDWMDGAIQKDDTYDTEIMNEGDDPFFHYSTNGRCATHCGLEDSCVCYQP